MSTTESTELLSDLEISTLNEARTILSRAAKRMPHTWEGGRNALACDDAENAVFMALNHLSSTTRPMTQEQVHNYDENGESKS